MPELGDEIQAVKAGLMEIGDIFVVNKCDLPGADKVIYNLQPVLSRREGWNQVAVKVSAKEAQGLDELVGRIEECARITKNTKLRQEDAKKRLSDELIENVIRDVSDDIRSTVGKPNELQPVLELLFDRKIDPESASNLLSRKYMKSSRLGRK